MPRPLSPETGGGLTRRVQDMYNTGAEAAYAEVHIRTLVPFEDLLFLWGGKQQRWGALMQVDEKDRMDGCSCHGRTWVRNGLC